MHKVETASTLKINFVIHRSMRMEDTKWTNKLLKIKDHIFPFIKMIKYLGKKGQPLKELTESQIISATQLINLIKSGKSSIKVKTKLLCPEKDSRLLAF